jgi:Flp pilus assembly protein TadD
MEPQIASVQETPPEPSSAPQDRRLFEKGRRLFAAGDVRGALGPLAEASRLLPHDPVVANAYGLALLRVGERDRALFNLQRAVLLAPGFPSYRVDMARALVAAGRREAAVQELEAVLRADPANAAAAEVLATLDMQAPSDQAAAGGAARGGVYTNEDLERRHPRDSPRSGAATSLGASPSAPPSPDRR